jgi:DNA polymerase-1
VTFEPLILVDGDIEAYRGAAIAQKKQDFGDTGSVILTHPEQAIDYMTSQIESYRERLKSDRVIVCLSSETNFRKDIWPDYKANRKDKERPQLLQFARQWLEENHACECWANLEADDVLGLLSWSNQPSVIVSVDKDLLNVPGDHFNPGHPEAGVVRVGLEEAYLRHMTQVLTGDSVDGYCGLPGVGPKKAEKIVKAVWPEIDARASVHDMIYDYLEGRIKLWEAICKLYEERGKTREDALTTARLAYICHQTGDYVRETGIVNLWIPPPERSLHPSRVSLASADVPEPGKTPSPNPC